MQPVTRILSAAVWLVFLCNAAPAQTRDLPLHRNSVIRFATTEEAAERLGTSDVFTRNTGAFDRQSRLGEAGDWTEEALLRYAAEQVRPWTDEEREVLTPLIEAVHDKLQAFQIPFPDVVLLIKTNGREEGGAAYCRSNAIILPEGMLRRRGGLERLLIHELFHITSRFQPERRRDLYSLVGFETCPPIPYPENLADRRITNPDAPEVDCTIRLRIDDREVVAAPILYSRDRVYDPRRGGSFFRSMQFRLMEVERGSDDQWVPRLVDERPILWDPREVPAYTERIGRNTGYIIHPEEILADNFVHMVEATAGLPTPDLVARLAEYYRPRPAGNGNSPREESVQLPPAAVSY